MKSKRYRILLFGWTGQVGSELLSSLSKEGDLFITSSTATSIPSFLGTAAESCVLDLTSTEKIAPLIRDIKPSIIINAAAYTAVDKAESEREIALSINGVAPGIMAAEAKALGAPLIHYSTDYVFDGRSSTPYKENDAKNPLNYYGQSKLFGENAITEASCDHIIFRTSWVVCKHGNNFLKSMLKLGSDRTEMKVVADQIGSPTSARFLAKSTQHMVALHKQNPSNFFEDFSGIYNLACTGETTWHHFAETIFAKARTIGFPISVESVKPITTKEWPTAAQRPLNSRLNTAKFTNTFGITPPSWESEISLILSELYTSKSG